MPRYHFHLLGRAELRDQEGINFADIFEARLHAARYAGIYLRDHPQTVWSGKDLRVDITDSSSLVLLTVILIAANSPAMTSHPALIDLVGSLTTAQ